VQTYIHTKFRPAYSPEKLTQQQTQSYTPPNPPARLSLMNAPCCKNKKMTYRQQNTCPPTLNHTTINRDDPAAQVGEFAFDEKKRNTSGRTFFFFPGTGMYKYILNHQTHIT
jgi:hypothetical protein